MSLVEPLLGALERLKAAQNDRGGDGGVVLQKAGGSGGGGLFATLGGKMIDPLVVKHSLRGSPIFSQGGKKDHPHRGSHATGDFQMDLGTFRLDFSHHFEAISHHFETMPPNGTTGTCSEAAQVLLYAADFGAPEQVRPKALQLLRRDRREDLRVRGGQKETRNPHSLSLVGLASLFGLGPF